MKTERYDVVIYEIATRKIQSFAGKNLPSETGFHTMEKRVETVRPRLNENYEAVAVPSGKYHEGDVVDLADSAYAAQDA